MIALAAALVVLALPANAGAFVYWINWNHTTAQGSIGRANLDGTHVNQNFITFPIGLEYEPQGVAVDGSHIYWSHGAIGRANLDGTGVDENFITPTPGAFAVAVDSSHVYWGSSDVIGRADLNGTNAANIAGSGQESIQALAVYSSPASGGAHIYYADTAAGGTVGRADLDGSNDNDFFIDTGGLMQGKVGAGMAVNATGIYWPGGDTLMSIGHSDFGPTNVSGNQIDTTARGLAIDGTYIYFGTGTGVGRANPIGTGIDRNFITGGTGVTAVAVDGLSAVVVPPPIAATTTALACSPASVTVPGSSSCTATVTGSSGASPPTGSVALSSSGAGVFGPATSCTLAPSGAASATCQATFAPSLAGSQTITAAYAGDATHAASSGTSTLQAAVTHSNKWVAAKPVLNKKAGTATLLATLPGPGKLVVTGTGVKRLTKHVTHAGKLKLTIKPSAKTAKKLKRHGTAKLKVKITYTPTGGRARSHTVKLTLKLSR